MPKTIIFNGRLITVTMEKPEDKSFAGGGLLYKMEDHRRKIWEYKKHLESLWQSGTECSAELLASYEEGTEVVEGKDYILRGGGTGRPDNPWRPIAFPLPTVEEGSQDEVWGFTDEEARKIEAMADDIFRRVKNDEWLMKEAFELISDYKMVAPRKDLKFSQKRCEKWLEKYQSQYKLTKI